MVNLNKDNNKNKKNNYNSKSEIIENVIEEAAQAGYDELDKKYNFPPSIDIIVKKGLIPFGVGALGMWLASLFIN